MSQPTINCCRTLSYNCFICKISFKTTSEFINHVHQKHILYECLCCPYTTVNYVNLQQHSRDKHNKYDLFHCPKCHFIGNDLNAIDQHYIQSHIYPSHTYYCTTCGFSTIFENDMRIHLCGNHKSSLLFCPCSVAPIANSEKKINTFFYNCSYCNYKTNKRPELSDHFMEIHWPGYASSDEEDDDEEEDDNSYYHNGYYNDDVHDDDDDYQYPCFICGEELDYYEKGDMMKHLRHHQTSINCLFCKKLKK